MALIPGEVVGSEAGHSYARRRTASVLCLVLFFFAFGVSGAQERVLVEAGSPAAYLANSADPGIGLTWVEPTFDHSAWLAGSYGFGFETGSGAEDLIETTVPVGTVSVFTRAVFNIDDPADADTLALGADYDDGYVVWINGIEVFRSAEMPPAGPLVWDSVPLDHESSNGFLPVYDPYQDISGTGIPALQIGANVLAVGVWNTSGASSDLLIVPRLVMNQATTLIRRPYLQRGTPTGITVRWRTSVPETTRVVYGTQQGVLDMIVEEPALTTTEHIVELTGLTADTTYYYAIGNNDRLLVGDDADHFFTTSPLAGTAKPTRIWFIGDSGTADARARSVRDAYFDFTAGRVTDVWVALGDNAYESGTDAEYQAALFDLFDELHRNTVLWPTIGNHDGISADSATESGPYYDIFTLPRAAEAGGLASGTEAYYSFDYGNIHFVVLDSEGSDRTAGSTMLTWLAADLAATPADWIIAYWHHPPYSKGSHDSDNPGGPTGPDLPLEEMRLNAVPICEAHGVDLIISGHSHSYERSFMIDGHYGDSTTFGPSHVVDGGDGHADGDGAYQKPLLGPDPNQGTVYTVAGNAGVVRGGTLDHPAMHIFWNLIGSVVVDVEDDVLDLMFIDKFGDILDYFTMVKGPFCPVPHVDTDGDLVCSDTDNCPATPNPDQEDADSDGQGNACDVCPTDPADDPDSDGVCNSGDNCPGDPNSGQEDADSDGQGDVCDSCPADPDDDIDSDGFCGDVDNCADDPNPLQGDADSDGLGDVCDGCPDDPDNDADDDGLCLGDDNCPDFFNPSQVDFDEDGQGNTCDPCPNDPDDDGDSDGVCGSVDNCVTVPNPVQLDTDLDDIGDACDICPFDSDNDFDSDMLCAGADNCPGAANPGQADADSDGIGDACDFLGDSDGDSVFDFEDNCPLGRNPSQTDTDSDGAGDVCDDDDDGDFVLDVMDCAPLSRGVAAPPGEVGSTLRLDKDFGGRLRWERGTQGHVSHIYRGLIVSGSVGPDDFVCLETENPGTESIQIQNPPLGQVFVYLVSAANRCGESELSPTFSGGLIAPCPPFNIDTDSDGVTDPGDNCPLTFNPGLPDMDRDFVGDACDGCPLDPFKSDPGLCGCGTPDTDVDTDGLIDCVDPCPLDALNDADSDGLCGNDDNCPDHPNPGQEDIDSDGQGDVCDSDRDNDGVLDVDDSDPTNPFVCRDVDSDGCDDCSSGTDNPSDDGPDSDGDGLCNFGDPDDDDDGVPDSDDSAPFDPFVCRDADSDGCDDCASGGDDPLNDGQDSDSDGLCDTGDPDDDNDGVPDGADNCPLDPNAGQADADSDGEGDVCDPFPDDPFNDQDGDGIGAAQDNCPTIPNPGQEDADSDGIGDACEMIGVAGLFRISTTEITNAQYVELLNAVATLDPNELFSTDMQNDNLGGITRSGSAGSFVYAPKADMGNKPVNFVSLLDAMRYANWLHNARPSGPQSPTTTEDGAYDLVSSRGGAIARESGARWFVPSRAEWDLAAYDDPTIQGDWLYPTRSDTDPTPAQANGVGDVTNPGLNVANYDDVADVVTSVGGPGSLSTSFWGTYDQGGNVAEWTDTFSQGPNRVFLRGGSFKSNQFDLRSTNGDREDIDEEKDHIGFRIAARTTTGGAP